MEELKTKAENLTEHISDLMDSYYKLAAVTATEKATDIGSGILGAVVISVLGFFIVFVSAFFLLVMVILFAIRKNIVFPFFRNSILRKIYG